MRIPTDKSALLWFSDRGGRRPFPGTLARLPVPIRKYAAQAILDKRQLEIMPQGQKT